MKAAKILLSTWESIFFEEEEEVIHVCCNINHAFKDLNIANIIPDEIMFRDIFLS